MAAFVASVFVLYGSAVHAQQAQPQRMLTLVDCPAGYALGVMDTASPQPLAKVPDPNAEADLATQDAAALAQQQTEAPRAFITICISPQTIQQK